MILAIIIPFYKLTYFEFTLQSLADQTDKRFKVYIGDDASTEDCSLLLKRFEEQFDFSYHRFETNLGNVSLTKQWERCIALSGDEEWLMILGDDDYLETNVIAAFYEHYEMFHHKCNVLRYATKVLNEVAFETSEIFKSPQFESGIQYISRKISGRARGSLSEFVFKRNEFLKFGFTSYPSAFYSDDRMVLDLSLKNSIYSINEATVYVRISSESLSGKAEKVNIDLFLAHFQFFKYLFENNYCLFDIKTKRILIEKLICYTIPYKKDNLLLFFKLYIRSLLFFDTVFFLKMNKKFIKLIIRKSID